MKIPPEWQNDLGFVDTGFTWKKANTNAGTFVLLACSTPLGTQVYWMPPDVAKQVAAGLNEMATGLLMAGADELPVPPAILTKEDMDWLNREGE